VGAGHAKGVAADVAAVHGSRGGDGELDARWRADEGDREGDANGCAWVRRDIHFKAGETNALVPEFSLLEICARAKFASPFERLETVERTFIVPFIRWTMVWTMFIPRPVP
jgi:hypothetical protein